MKTNLAALCIVAGTFLLPIGGYFIGQGICSGSDSRHLDASQSYRAEATRRP
jgi:hypothetical protein